MCSPRPSSKRRRRRSSLVDQYAAVADDYHWFVTDAELRLGSRTPGVCLALASLAPGARVLDAACGIGSDAVALARRGVDVTIADASEPMLEHAARRLASTPGGHRAEVLHSTWTDLPAHFESGRFDAVLCLGNSIAHVRDTAEMTETFASFAWLLGPGGRLVLDTHDWARVVAAGDHTVVDPDAVVRGVRTCRRRYSWRVPDRELERCRTVELEIELAFQDQLGRSTQRQTIRLHPFGRADLRSTLFAAGFDRVAIDALPGHDRYTSVATRGDPSAG